jgi:DNA polymerase-4
MPLRTAFQRCPDAAFLPIDAGAYRVASQRVMTTLRTFPAVLEVAGWDEAFMEVLSEDPRLLALDVQRAVLDRTELWCSIGIGDNKLRAKIASKMAKPAGLFRLTAENWREVMDELPPQSLWGVGPNSQKRLEALGITTVGRLAHADQRQLMNAFGPRDGHWIQRLATGEVHTPVTDAPHKPKSRGRERTFQQDLTDPAEIRAEISTLARDVARDLQENDQRPATRVEVKVRFAPFVTRTHGSPLPARTMDAEAIERVALETLRSFELDRPVRLLGVKVEIAPSDGFPD